MFAHLSSQRGLLSWRGAPESLEAEVLAISAYTLRCVALHWDNYCFRKLDSVGFAFLHWLDFVWVWNCTECRGRGSWSSALCPGNRNKSSVEHSLHFHIIAHGLHSRLFSLSQSIGLSVYLLTCKDSMSHFLSLPSFFFSSSSKWWERPLPESTSICVRVGTRPSSSLTTSLTRLSFTCEKRCFS